MSSTRLAESRAAALPAGACGDDMACTKAKVSRTVTAASCTSSCGHSAASRAHSALAPVASSVAGTPL